MYELNPGGAHRYPYHTEPSKWTDATGANPTGEGKSRSNHHLLDRQRTRLAVQVTAANVRERLTPRLGRAVGYVTSRIA